MKHLSLTIVFEGSNLNYGEGFGNILTLKKISSRNKNFSYISRQALRYDIVRIMNESFGMDLTEVNKEKGVVQFVTNAKIDKYPEIDFFGYMKTERRASQGDEEGSEGKTKIRKAIARLSDAVSLEAFNNEIEFATNKGLADRIGQNNDIFQAEIHKSFYSYTLTLDLDKVGVDENDSKVKVSKEEKIKRVNMLLDSIKLLHRDIRGKRENLSPVFVIGGIYNIGNPFFYNRISLTFTKDKILVNQKELNNVLETTTIDNEIVSKNTNIGFIDGIFNNIDEIKVNQKISINSFFENIKSEVEKVWKE